ncbi:MAG: hypothetical protein F6J89_21635 [Symploca sp. SIO1C4]|uniref:Uncharacterized protein n=1 Tax=Symploca sp. SIO1C4 TaxID=2607765 RepID=A0A6B3NLT0_9CYAN|nr:hypothetical protein [Symploca sp. SIO1C4]
MALAIVDFKEHKGNKIIFNLDIGTTNRFYAYSIGDDRTFTRNGLTFLENARFVSPVFGPLPPETLGRTLLEIPSSRFDSRYRYLQLFSFRDHNRTGPALSEIIPVPVTSSPVSLSFSTPNVMDNQPVDTVPFSYQESYSESMGFLDGLIKTVGKVASGVVKAVKAVAPVAAPILTGILGPEAGVAVTGVTKLLDSLLPGTGGQPQKIKAQLQNPDTLNQIVSLISQLQNAKAAPSTAKALSFDGYSPFPGRVMMPPEVFDHMPSLMPLLGRSLHPETVRTISSGPMRGRVLMGTITQGALEAGKHFPGFIRAIADELNDDDPALIPLRNSLNGREREYHRQETVRLHFSGIRPQVTGGSSRVLYRIDQDIAFPLVLDTPRPITRGTVQLLVKNPETLEVLAEQKYRVEDLRSGPVDGRFRLGREQLRSLKPNEEYLICAVLTWTARSSRTGNKKRLGTSTAVLVTLVGDYIFERLEGVEETFALNDPKEYRPYWHKIWQGDFSEDGQRIALDCKYYYVLEPKERNNARMETMLHMNDRDTSDQSGKLKTGMVLSPRQLERLLAWISDKPRLDDEEMAALACSEFRDSFHQLARTQVEFEGDEGDSATLWVYPEVDLRRVVLKQVMDSDANGRVLELSERTVYFPIPSVARFVGTSS